MVTAVPALQINQGPPVMNVLSVLRMLRTEAF